MRSRLRTLVLVVVALGLVVLTGASVLADGGGRDGTRGGPSRANHDTWGPIEATHRWALGYDERDLELMRDAFTDDARFVFHLASGGEPLVYEGIDEVMELFTSSLESQDDVRRHVTTNHLVEHHGPRRAEVVSYLTLLVIDDPTASPHLQSSGVYTDTVVRERDGVWRIEERVLELDTPS